MFNNLLGIQTALAQTAAASTEKSTSTPFNVLEFIFSNAPLWITAVVVFIVSLIVATVVKSAVEIRLARKISEEQKEMQIMTGRVAYVIVLFIGISLSLTIAGINMTTLLAAIGFGLSFGLQDIVSNFVAGLYILASRPFTIGDWIEIGGRKGKVEMIGSRATFLRTYDGLRLIVPNAQLFKNNVLSYTSNPLRRLKIPVYSRYLISIKDVFNICMNAARSNKHVYIEPKPNVVIMDMADYYMYFELRVWVDSKGLWRRVQSDLFGEIQKKLEEAGLDSPYPTTSLSLDTDTESVVVKTKNVNDQEMMGLLAERAQDEVELSKRRAELVKLQQIMQQPENYDQSGTNFLQAVAQTPTQEVPVTAASGASSAAAENSQPVQVNITAPPVQPAQQPPQNQ